MNPDLDDLQFSPETLKALREFNAESSREIMKDSRDLTINDFKEDWQLSQFWYSNETANCYAHEAIKNTEDDAWIGCISCPALFLALSQMRPVLGNRKIFIFEYDRRFDVFGEEFVYYDLNNPTELPEYLNQRFTYLVSDPPFLSHECWSKTKLTLQWLSAASPQLTSVYSQVLISGMPPPYLKEVMGKIAICSGTVMRENFLQIGCRQTAFKPSFLTGLANNFGLFLNYTSQTYQLADDII